MATEHAAAPQYPEIGAIPQHKHMTACEVLCWIGYRRAIPKEVYYWPATNSPEVDWSDKVQLLHAAIPEPKPATDPMDDAERELMRAWRDGQIVPLVTVDGKLAPVSDEVHNYAVAINTRGGIEVDAGASDRDQEQARRFLAAYPVPGGVLFEQADVVWIWRANWRSPSVPDLPNDPELSRSQMTALQVLTWIALRKTELTKDEKSSPEVEEMFATARQTLRAELVAGRITAWATPEWIPGADPDRVPAGKFGNPWITLSDWGVIGPDPMTKTAHRRPKTVNQKKWQDTYFLRHEVLSLWPAAPAPRGRGGRKPKYKWGPVIEALRAKLVEDGAPAEGDGGQAELERFVQGLFPADDCPSPSLIREKVTKELQEFRDRVGAKAGN